MTTSVNDLSPVMSAEREFKKGILSTMMINVLGVMKDMQGFSYYVYMRYCILHTY